MDKPSILGSMLFSTTSVAFVALVFFCLCAGVANSVPVVPNETVLEGFVIELCLTSSSSLSMSPPQTLYKLVVSVEKVEEAAGHPNFLKGREGQSITLYSKERQPPEIFGKKIRATVKYVGDERGGLYWMNRLEVMK
jgi:hypothetical protein